MDLESFYFNLLLQWQVTTQALTPLLTRLCLDTFLCHRSHCSIWTVMKSGGTCEQRAWMCQKHHFFCVWRLTPVLHLKEQRQTTSPLETMMEAVPSLNWDWVVPFRLVRAISFPSREKALHPKSWLHNLTSWGKEENILVIYSLV